MRAALRVARGARKPSAATARVDSFAHNNLVGSGTSVTVSATTTQPNELIVVCVQRYSSNTGTAISTVTVDGNAATLVGVTGAKTYGYVAPSAGSHSVVVTFSVAANDYDSVNVWTVLNATVANMAVIENKVASGKTVTATATLKTGVLLVVGGVGCDGGDAGVVTITDNQGSAYTADANYSVGNQANHRAAHATTSGGASDIVTATAGTVNSYGMNVTAIAVGT